MPAWYVTVQADNTTIVNRKPIVVNGPTSYPLDSLELDASGIEKDGFLKYHTLSVYAYFYANSSDWTITVNQSAYGYMPAAGVSIPGLLTRLRRE